MKKKIIIISCALLFFVLTLSGTLAFLTDSDETGNTITIGNVEITLDETAVDEYGVPIPNAERRTNNVYNVIAGNEYTKDPTVTLDAGSENSYTRMTVTLSHYTELKEVFGETFKPEDYVLGHDNTKWVLNNSKENNDNTITYEYRYYKVVNGYEEQTAKDNILEPLFEKIKVPETMTKEDLLKLEDFNIKIVAHAIQSDGFENATEAWDAFSNQNGS